MKILMLSATFPYPPGRGGTQVRTFHLLKYLGQRHSVTLLTQETPEGSQEAEREALRQWVTELVVFPYPRQAPGGILQKVQRFSNFLRQGIPPNVLALYSPEMQSWVDRAVQEQQVDVITCEHSVNEIYVRPEFRQSVQTIVDIHSSVYGTCKNQLQTGTAEKPFRDRLNLPLLKRYEQNYCTKFNQLVVTTEDDRQQFQELTQHPAIQVVPNGVDLEEFTYRPADPGGHSLIFIGAMDYIANVDTARFLALEILPRVQERYADASLFLVGNRPTEAVKELAQRPGVKVTGRVPSTATYLHQATVCVVPMRIGFGIKNKTLEAMAAGVPVVASDRGLEGLAIDQPGIPLRALRANQVEEYVAAICRLFEQPDLRTQLSRNGRDYIEQEYTWEIAGQRYEQILATAV